MRALFFLLLILFVLAAAFMLAGGDDVASSLADGYNARAAAERLDTPYERFQQNLVNSDDFGVVDSADGSLPLAFWLLFGVVLVVALGFVLHVALGGGATEFVRQGRLTLKEMKRSRNVSRPSNTPQQEQSPLLLEPPLPAERPLQTERPLSAYGHWQVEQPPALPAQTGYLDME